MCNFANGIRIKRRLRTETMKVVWRRPASIALAALLASLLSLAGLGTSSSANANLPFQAGGEGSPCDASVTRSVSPGFILRGETVTVRLSTNFTCPGETAPLHLVLVLDASFTMAGDRTAEMQREAKRLIQRLDMKNNPHYRVGVVQYSSEARVLCELTNDAGQAHLCVGRIPANGSTALDKGITAGINVIRHGRRFVPGITPLEVLLVLSDGTNNEGCPPVVRAAGKAKGQGILVISVCLGPDCDRDCMRQVASSSRYFFDVPSADDLAAAFDAIWNALSAYGVKQIIITEQIPANIELIESSLSAEMVFDPTARTIVWRATHAPSLVTMSYKIRPLASGHLDTNGPSTMTFRDIVNRPGNEILPVGKILVLGR